MTRLVRAATPEDADAACAAIRRSITECCVADHDADPGVLAAWLANKTSDNLRNWILSPDACAVVAELNGHVVGFALSTIAGEVSLCYLAPEAHGFGLGRAMIAALEADAIRRNLTELTVRSTRTAHPFYLRLGFVDAGPAQRGRFITAHPMRKPLTSASTTY